MAWVRIDDAFAQHPKIAKAGPLAMAMQIAGLCSCNRNLTDGFIPRGVARTLLDWEIVDAAGAVCTLAYTNGMSGNDVTSEWVIAQLVDSGIWIEEQRGYRIHGYLEYQPSAEDVKRQRERTKSRVKQWRSRNLQDRNDESNSERNADRNTTGNGVTNGPVTPAPVPDPVPLKERVEGAQPSAAPTANGAHSTETREARGKRLDVHALPDDWRIFCQTHRKDLDPEHTFQQFHDYWIAQPGAKGRKTDWLATWRNWVRNEKAEGQAPNKKPDFKNW